MTRVASEYNADVIASQEKMLQLYDNAAKVRAGEFLMAIFEKSATDRMELRRGLLSGAQLRSRSKVIKKAKGFDRRFQDAVSRLKPMLTLRRPRRRSIAEGELKAWQNASRSSIEKFQHGTFAPW
jgi:hypothetical protein